MKTRSTYRYSRSTTNFRVYINERHQVVYVPLDIFTGTFEPLDFIVGDASADDMKQDGKTQEIAALKTKIKELHAALDDVQARLRKLS